MEVQRGELQVEDAGDKKRREIALIKGWIYN